MKLICCSLLLMLCPLWSLTQAADVRPTQIEPIDRDLARPQLQLHKTGDLSLGLSFQEEAQFVVDPGQTRSVPSRSIDRQLLLAARLPLRFELGLSLRGHQESMPTAEGSVVDAAAHPLATLYWARWYLIQNETWRTSLLLQYEPAAGSAANFHQLSQDRSSLALTQEYSPWSWLHAGLFAGFSRREGEVYRGYRLGSETIFGGRLTVGPSVLQAFVDGQKRSLQLTAIDAATSGPSSLENMNYRAGLGTKLGAYDFSVAATLPASKLEAGSAEEGYLLRAGYIFGDRTALAAETSETKKAQKKKLKKGQAETLVDVPVANIEKGPSEPDEFELLEHQLEKDRSKNSGETLSERAERELTELKAQKEREKSTEEIDQKRRQRDEDRAVGQQIKEENELRKEYSDEINEELDQYALPDAEELNWRGLK